MFLTKKNESQCDISTEFVEEKKDSFLIKRLKSKLFFNNKLKLIVNLAVLEPNNIFIW